MNKRLLLLFSLVFSTIIGNATHIMHGNVYYEFLNTGANNNDIYKISIVVYRDCGVNSADFDSEIEIGIYSNDPNKSLSQKIKIPLTDNTSANPFFLSASSGPFCLKKGIYTTTAAIPVSSTGYHVLYQRCCRFPLRNIADESSSAFYAFIPAVPNSNPLPHFDAPLVADADQWYNLNFGNIDKDGDTLTYTLTAPLNGQTTSGNPIPSLPSTLPIPIPIVKYNNGFSAQKPLGNKGEFIVYAKNGNIRLMTSTTGIFVMGIKIMEWRNGVLLAEHYREISMYSVGAVLKNAVMLTGKPVKGKEITLNWLYGINASVKQMALRRRTEHDTIWQNIAAYDSTHFAYTDTAIEIDSLYWYQVIANTDSSSVKSNIVKISLNPNVWPTRVYTPATPVFTAYPNPVNDRLFINDEKGSISAVIITDIRGRTLYETADMEEIKTKGLHTGFLPAGIYLLQAVTPNGVQTLRIIKE